MREIRAHFKTPLHNPISESLYRTKPSVAKTPLRPGGQNSSIVSQIVVGQVQILAGQGQIRAHQVQIQDVFGSKWA